MVHMGPDPARAVYQGENARTRRSGAGHDPGELRSLAREDEPRRPSDDAGRSGQVDPGQARIATQHFAFQAGSPYGHIAQAVQGLPCTGVVGNVHSLQRNSENHALFFRHHCSSLALPAWHALCLCHKLAQDVLASYRSTCLWRDASMGTALHILHLEDNPDDQELVRLTLVKEGMSGDLTHAGSQERNLTPLNSSH